MLLLSVAVSSRFIIEASRRLFHEGFPFAHHGSSSAEVQSPADARGDCTVPISTREEGRTMSLSYGLRLLCLFTFVAGFITAALQLFFVCPCFRASMCLVIFPAIRSSHAFMYS